MSAKPLDVARGPELANGLPACKRKKYAPLAMLPVLNADGTIDGSLPPATLL